MRMRSHVLPGLGIYPQIYGIIIQRGKRIFSSISEKSKDNGRILGNISYMFPRLK